MSEASIALIAGIPCDASATSAFFADIRPRSFADEWRMSQPQAGATDALVSTYLAVVPRIWRELSGTFQRLRVATFPNATSRQLTAALAEFDVIAILAHNVADDAGRSTGLELMDRVLDVHEIERIAPTRPCIVHLGVCRASEELAELFKSRCDAVRVISSQIGVDPEFYLRIVAATAQLCRERKSDYSEAHASIRSAMLSHLGA